VGEERSVDNAGAIIELTHEGKIKFTFQQWIWGKTEQPWFKFAPMNWNRSGRIEIITGDTDLVLKAGSVTGERATYCAGNAVIMAVRGFKKGF
jgi:CO/xanthine dehydrogenase Mo-binding subunit